MSTLRNKVILIGHVCATPEIKNLEDSKKIAKFTIATNETYYNDKQEKITNTSFHQVIAWNKTAEIAEKYIDKGKEVCVEGKLSYRSYDDKDGAKKYITEIIISELILLGK